MLGQIIDFAGLTVPSKFLECTGRSLSRVTYSDLFAVIGTTYGAPDSDTFNIPNLKGTAAIGAGGTRSSGPNAALGSSHNSDNVTIGTANLPRHAHALTGFTETGGAHTHTYLNVANIGGGQGYFTGRTPVNQRTSSVRDRHDHSIQCSLDSEGEGADFSVQNPSMTMMKIIKVQE